MGSSLTPTVALRRRPGVTPADMVRISRCRPNVRPLARRADNKHASPYTGEPNNPASRLQGRSTPLDLHSTAAANTEAPEACQHQHGGDPCSGLPPPPLTSRRPFLSYTGRGAFFLFGKTKRKNGGRREKLNACMLLRFLCFVYSLKEEAVGFFLFLCPSSVSHTMQRQQALALLTASAIVPLAEASPAI